MSKQQIQAFIASEHGFFDDLVTMLVSLSSYMFTMHVSLKSNHPKPFKERTLDEWMSYIAPIKNIEHPLALSQNATNQDLVVYPTMLLMHISLNGWPTFIEYRSVPRKKSEVTARLSSHGNSQVIARIVGASFTNYYSKCETIVKAKYGTNVDTWPEPIRFAWILRNGFAHGGKIKISNQMLRPAIWKIWSFSYQQDGLAILFEAGMLAVGDVILLMQDVDALIR